MRSSYSAVMTGLVLFGGGIALAIAAQKVSGDPSKAEPIVTENCAACHGQDGNPPAPNFPKLAGQHAEYLLRELKAYKAEHRVSELMQPMVVTLTEEDMANLAVYFSIQKPEPGIVTKPELLALGKKIYFEGNSDTGVPSCDGCHEEDGSGSGRFPRVAGQYVEYTLEEFKRYASGDRSYGAKVMRVIAQRLTEQEAEAVAQYMASMK